MSTEKELHQRRKDLMAERLGGLLGGDDALARRFHAVKSFSARVRASEYHLTNACNIRCKGCWFFEFGHDVSAAEARDIEDWKIFVGEQKRRRRINSALLIGGEPTLFMDRIRAFAEQMRFVSVSTNGLRPLPRSAPFDNICVFVTLFGGGPLDDDLRGIKPGGRRFSGLFGTALNHYRDDPRVTFVYAVTERGLAHIAPTVRRIQDNGNVATFNYYSEYNEGHPLKAGNGRRLLDEMLAARDAFPDTVLNHPAHIEAMVTGRTWCGEFGADTCPSVSQDHPGNAQRRLNGNPTLTFFNTYKADLQTLELCCTSGHCSECRDSQAVYSWLLVSLEKSLDSVNSLRTWVEAAESYWSQFIWSPFHRTAATTQPSGNAA